MKKYLSILIAIFCSSVLFAGSWQWAERFGSDGMERAWDLAVDYPQSDIFVSGEFTDSLTVDMVTYYGNGLSDCFIIKYNELGQVEWTKTFGSSEGDVCLSISVDASGNCYFTGYYIGTLTMGNWQIQGNGMWDVFYGKLNPDGDLLWLKSFGGTLNDIGYGIAVTDAGEVFITGWFADSVSFGSNIDISSYGGSDIFLAKFDTDGNPLWAHHAGTAGVEYGYKVDVSLGGDAYITGSVSPGSSFDDLITDSAGMFVAKYASDGTIQWVLPSYGAGVNNISVSQSDPLARHNMVVGRVTGTALIGDTLITTNDGSDDIYTATFNADGEWTDVEHYGGIGSDKGRGIDVRDNYVAISSFEQDIDFNGSVFSSNGEADVALISSNLPPVCVGGINSDVGTDVKFLSNGRIVMTGWFSGSFRLGQYVLHSGDDTDTDGFVALYNPNITANEDDVSTPVSSISSYPNPSASIFNIKAGLSSQIKIFNTRGQLVRTLFPLETKEDVSTFQWNSQDDLAQRCPSGIYILKTEHNSSRIILINK